VGKEGRPLQLLGTEIDQSVLEEARALGLSKELVGVELRDFVLDPPKGPFQAIVANPPYIRHHRLSADTKHRLQSFGVHLIGKRLDGRAGLHIYFLLRALELLAKNGRLAFIMPADTVEGIFAGVLWRWIVSRYSLDAVITFDYQASPFPSVDTNPLIFMIRNASPGKHFFWIQCIRSGGTHLFQWVTSGFDRKTHPSLLVFRRTVPEGLATGLSRPRRRVRGSSAVLGDYAGVLRGIATGSNDFFHITVDKARALGIPSEFLVPAIGRTRDAEVDVLTPEALSNLEKSGRPTLLFSPDGRPLEAFPPPVQEYIKQGEVMGLHRRPLVAMRRPWYKMEVRPAPPILFAYLGRRHARFIWNRAGVRPLSGFLCVYPHRGETEFVERLWKVLQHPQTIKNLAAVGKSYGGGAIKVEPRALERLPLPDQVLIDAGLTNDKRARQIPLLRL
jgi:hypothetical protein